MEKIKKKDLPSNLVKFLVDNGILKKYLEMVNNNPSPAIDDLILNRELHEKSNNVARMISVSLSKAMLGYSEHMLWKRARVAAMRNIPMKRTFVWCGYVAYVYGDKHVQIGCQTIQTSLIFDIYNRVMLWFDDPNARDTDISTKWGEIVVECIITKHGTKKFDVLYTVNEDDEPAFESELDVYIEDFMQIANEITKYNRYWRK